MKFYNLSKNHFGFLNWWPGETFTEIIIGAVLTQNTAWINVEKAIKNLKDNDMLDFNKLLDSDEKHIASLIKPSGYFNQKAKKLKKIADFFSKHTFDDLKSMDLMVLRESLLNIWGIGKETADSILLYALDKRIFVIDAYTKRIFQRHGLWNEDISYDDMQKIIMDNIPEDLSLYNDFHAQIVELGKNFCKKNRALCNECPISPYLSFTHNVL